MFKKASKRVLTLLLALMLLAGMLPAAAAADAPRGELEGAAYDTEARLARKVNLSETDESELLAAVSGKTGADVRSLSGTARSMPAGMEADYVSGVAGELTEPLGVVGMDDLSPDDAVYVFIWLQELPDALKRVYNAESISAADYSAAASDADAARSAIRAMGEGGASYSASSAGPGGNQTPRTLEIEYEYFEVFAGFAVRTTKGKAAEIAAIPGVYAVTEVGYSKMDYTADPDYTTPGNAGARELMEIADLHGAGIDGTGVKVAVIDSGIDAAHPDLIGAYRGGYNFADKTADMTRQDGDHGTHVSGTIASQGRISLGAAPGAELYMGQVFSQTNPNSASEADVTAAIEAFTKGDPAKGLPKVDIINMSLGSTVNTAYQPDHYTRNNAVIAGVLIVNSAGNEAYPEGSADDRRNYTLGSGGVSLPVSVAAAQLGGSLMLSYDMTASDGKGAENTLTAAAENSDAVLSGLFIDGSFGPAETHTVTYHAGNTGSDPNIWLTENYFGTYVRNPLEYAGGKGYEFYYACGGAGEMSAEEMDALKALPADLLIGKILVVNRGQNFTDYLGEALRLGAGAVIVLNRDPSPVGNMVIGGAASADIAVLSGSAAGKQVLLDTAAETGGYGWLNPGELIRLPQPSEPADFSSIGPVNETAHIKPDIIGPGGNVLSTSLNGGYTSMSGTSMSSPWVAGVAALVKQQYPNAAPAEIKARLMNTADNDIIEPLSARLSNPNNYFNAAGTEISVFEQGAGYVNPKRAVYEDVYITVENDAIPTGNTDGSVMTAEMASFSFGVTSPGTESAALTASVHGGSAESIEVVYNHDTRYSNANLNGEVTVSVTNNGGTFDARLLIAENANTDQRNGGNLYEGYILVTAGGSEYVLPWATRVGEFTEPESDFWLVYPDRPVQAANGHPNQDFEPYSSENFIYFIFEGKEIADSVPLTAAGTPGDYTYILFVYMLTAPNPALAYRVPIIVAEGQESLGLKLSDFIEVGPDAAYYVPFDGSAYGLNAAGNMWLNTLSYVQPGSYNLTILFEDGYNWYGFSGITFNETRPTLTVEGVTFGNDYETDHGYLPGAEEVTVSGGIYSAALAEAADMGFGWAGLYVLLYGEYYYLDQSYNVLIDGWSGGECEVEGSPYICDAEGGFSLTFPITGGGYFFPSDFSESGVVYAADAFNSSLLPGDKVLAFGSLTSYLWLPEVRPYEIKVVPESAALTDGAFTAMFEYEDGSIPAEEDLDAGQMTVVLTCGGADGDRPNELKLTEYSYEPASGTAIWSFPPFNADTSDPLLLSASLTYDGGTVTSVEEASCYINRYARYIVKHMGTNGVTLGTDRLTQETGSVAAAASKRFSGYTFDGNAASGVAAGDGSLVLTLNYTPNSNITYTVRYFIYQSSGASVWQRLMNDKTVRGQTMAATVTEEAKPFAGYTPDRQSKNLKLYASDNVLTFYYSPNTDTPFKVRHVVSTDGTLLEEEALTGTTGVQVSAKAKEFPGYVYDGRVVKGYIDRNGGLVMTLKYEPAAAPAEEAPAETEPPEEGIGAPPDETGTPPADGTADDPADGSEEGGAAADNPIDEPIEEYAEEPIDEPADDPAVPLKPVKPPALGGVRTVMPGSER